jgi:hypothetical protein
MARAQIHGFAAFCPSSYCRARTSTCAELSKGVVVRRYDFEAHALGGARAGGELFSGIGYLELDLVVVRMCMGLRVRVRVRVRVLDVNVVVARTARSCVSILIQ